MLSTSAFNALLKTIEEPPPYVVFIFATTELQKVPATIKSRCQQFNFRLVPVEQVKNLLAEASKEIGVEADDEALYWIARESTGSIRDAYTLFDQVAAFSDGHITYEKIRDKLGLVGVDRLNELFEKCCDGESENVINKLDEYLQSGVSIEQLISNSADYLRSLLLLKNGVRKEALLGQAPERYSHKVLDSWSSIQLERALSLFLQLYRDIRYSLSPRFEVELNFSRLCWLKEYVSPAEVKKAIDNAKNLLLQGEGARIQSESIHVQSEGSSGAGASLAAGSPRQFGGQSSTSGYRPSSASGQVHSGMPTFSALNNAFAPSNTGADSETMGDYPPMDEPPDIPPPEEENAHSFSLGGALPPEQSAAATSSNLQQNLSAEDLKKRLVDELTQKDDGFTASSIMQAFGWVLNGNEILVTVDNGFKKSHLEKQKSSIAEILSRICGKPMQFSVELKNTQQAESGAVELPQSVDMICKMFRGTVIGGKI